MMMVDCDDVRDHLESCEECRLHIAVEARLRTQPVMEPPAGLVDRAMRALPRAVPLRREILRLASAAALLVALAIAAIAANLDRDARVVEARAAGEEFLRAAAANLNPFNLRSEP